MSGALLLAWAMLVPSAKPIPDASEMKQRVVKSFRASQDALESYSCMVRESSDELGAEGTVKKRSSSVKEQFFVNRVQIEHTLERNGAPLAPAEAKKEQARVDKEVKKYSDPAQADKVRTRDEKQAVTFLRALELTNGRREQRLGRETLVYDLSGDPKFHAKTLDERFAEALTGQIAIDEPSSTPIDIQFQTKRDVRIGGGLLANLHKGFWLHITQQREPGGVWITKDVQGSGDARAALFVHARFRFRQELQKCRLFTVTTEQQIHQ